MATTPDRQPTVARVDHIVDERGNVIDVPDDTALRVSSNVEDTVGNTGPTSWWRRGLIALGIVAALLLLLQLMGGNTGTP